MERCGFALSQRASSAGTIATLAWPLVSACLSCLSSASIVVASAKAYLSALSKMAVKTVRVNPQYGTEAALVP